MMQLNKKEQSGVVLVGGLFFLMVMTLVGVATIKNIALEEKIAGNAKEKLRSFEAAEIALKIADKHLEQNPDILPFYAPAGNGNVPGLYTEDGDTTQPWEENDAWSVETSLKVSDDINVPENVRVSQSDIDQLGLHGAPRYMIGLVGEQGLDGMDSGITQRFFIFTATSRADSGLGHIRTTLQTRIIQSL